MNTNKEDMRELAAQLYAVVVSTMSGNELKTAVQNLIKITRDTHVCSFYFLFCVLCIIFDMTQLQQAKDFQKVLLG